MKEIWKDIKNFEGFYQISNLGRVKSLERKVKNKNGYRIVKEKILCNYINNNGYYCVNLRKKCGIDIKLIHRLIGEYFMLNPNNYPVINHIDGNKLNNNIDNLEWCTYQHNIKEAFRLGLNKYTYNENFKNVARKVLQFDKSDNFIKEYNSIREANRITGISYNSIFMNCHGKQKYAGDYIWKFKEEK